MCFALKRFLQITTRFLTRQILRKTNLCGISSSSLFPSLEWVDDSTVSFRLSPWFDDIFKIPIFFCQLLDFPCLFFVLCRVDRRVQRMIFKVEKLEIIFGSFYDNVPLFKWNWNYGFKPEKWECSNLFFLQ